MSQAVPADQLEQHTLGIAREIASRHLAPLEHHKITVQMGRDLSLSQAIQLDQLVGQRMRGAMDLSTMWSPISSPRRAGRI